MPCLLLPLLSARAETMVQWGEITNGPGSTNIVVANQNFLGGGIATYTGNTNNPAVGANYYPNNADHSPYFAAGASTSLPTKIVEGASSGDRITIYQSVAQNVTFRGMVMWTSNFFLPGASSLTLTSVSMVINQRLNANTTNQGVRVVVEQGGSYFASGSMSFGASVTTNSFSIAGQSWYAFTPFSSGVETIGSLVAAPSFAGVQAVGYYFTAENGGVAAANTGAQVSYFSALGFTAIPEPSLLGLLGLGALVAARLARRGA
jgi:hypothetical protein